MGTPVMTMRLPQAIFDLLPEKPSVYARNALLEAMVRDGHATEAQVKDAVKGIGTFPRIERID